jgi:hypothetical protein
MTRVEPTGAFAQGVIVGRDPGDENDAVICQRCGEIGGKLRFDGRWPLEDECDPCWDNPQEPGDSYFEDCGAPMRHELQDASGVWRR